MDHRSFIMGMLSAVIGLSFAVIYFFFIAAFKLLSS